MKTLKIFLTLAIVAFTGFHTNAQPGWDSSNNNTGTFATALGTNTTATGYASTALGYKSTASGSQSFAAGHWSGASGNYSFALGARAFAQNHHAMAFGIDVRATTNRSMILGTGIGNGVSNAMVNNIPNSLMVGFNSTKPTLFVGSSSGGSTIGKVGVGTTNPQANLDVISEARITSGTYSNRTYRITSGSRQEIHASNDLLTYSGQNNGILLNTINNANGAFFVKNKILSSPYLFMVYGNTGKVAIGTQNTPNNVGSANTSAYKLFVKGGILTEEVRVRTGWADYVFADEYNLKPLSEVEAFIKENKHLPNVPSANTVENQGIELGNISKIQQEKIEELTLYTIDQQKQIDELMRLVYELKNRNN